MLSGLPSPTKWPLCRPLAPLLHYPKQHQVRLCMGRCAGLGGAWGCLKSWRVNMGTHPHLLVLAQSYRHYESEMFIWCRTGDGLGNISSSEVV